MGALETLKTEEKTSSSLSGNKANEVPRGTLTYSTSTDSFWRKQFIQTVEFLSGRRKLERMYKEILDQTPSSEEIWRLIFEKLELSYRIVTGSLEEIPEEGPCIIVANHPFGVVDGVVLGHLVKQKRPKFKFLVNEVLCREPLLDPYLLPIDFKETKAAVRTNLETRKEALACLDRGECIVIFPAGAVSTSPGFFRKAVDLEWKRFVGKLIKKSEALVIPIYFEGHNSWIFQFASQLSEDLRLGVLLHEVTNKIGNTIDVSIRKKIPFTEIKGISKVDEVLNLLRRRVFNN